MIPTRTSPASMRPRSASRRAPRPVSSGLPPPEEDASCSIPMGIVLPPIRRVRSIPTDILRQPLGERSAGGVAQLGRGPADVGIGLADVPRLLGQPPDGRLLAQGCGDRVDEPP